MQHALFRASPSTTPTPCHRPVSGLASGEPPLGTVPSHACAQRQIAVPNNALSVAGWRWPCSMERTGFPFHSFGNVPSEHVTARAFHQTESLILTPWLDARLGELDFGMKAHIGVDDQSGLVHTVVGITAKVSDMSRFGELLQGEEECVSAPGPGASADPRASGREPDRGLGGPQDQASR